MRPQVLIIGASTRSAAFSALRAGWEPWCSDLFGDVDLLAKARFLPAAREQYPLGFVDIEGLAPPGPWIYTGGMENHPNLIEALSQTRVLWGNSARTVRVARSPVDVSNLLGSCGLRAPETTLHPPAARDKREWLIKPLAGAGGRGIRVWSPGHPVGKGCYWQEFVPGSSVSAIFTGDARQSCFLGATKQLVGEPWLNAALFHYCGSVGPLELNEEQVQTFIRLGEVLTSRLGLRGLFGVDCVLGDGQLWTLEINPRYTASVEVWEYAFGASALDLHRRAFEQDSSLTHHRAFEKPKCVIGKGILFAGRDMVFPAAGPWERSVRIENPLTVMPEFADIPQPLQAIRQGQPILTILVRASNHADCICSLRAKAAETMAMYFGSKQNSYEGV